MTEQYVDCKNQDYMIFHSVWKFHVSALIPYQTGRLARLEFCLIDVFKLLDNLWKDSIHLEFLELIFQPHRPPICIARSSLQENDFH